MGIRRTITVLVSASALAVLSVPMAVPVSAAPTGVDAGAHWYEGKTGTVQWAIGSEFLAQLDAAGAEMSFCRAARMSQSSGVTIVTMPVHGNSAIELNGPQAGVDATTDCVVTITGNNTSVELTNLTFGVTSDTPSSISASVGDEYVELGSGSSKKLPKQATRNKITVTSPVIVLGSAFADVLRGQQNETGAYEGPVPTMTTEPATLGLFRLMLKVKSSPGPVSSGNSEG